MNTQGQSLPAKPEPTPTPFTDSREHHARLYYKKLEEAGWPAFDDSAYDHARTLERHLRRIVECKEKLTTSDIGSFAELMFAIRDAKETLSK